MLKRLTLGPRAWAGHSSPDRAEKSNESRARTCRQPLEGRLLPVTQEVGVHALLRRELADGFGFLQQLQGDLGFEGGATPKERLYDFFMRLFYRTLAC